MFAQSEWYVHVQQSHQRKRRIYSCRREGDAGLEDPLSSSIDRASGESGVEAESGPPSACVLFRKSVGCLSSAA
jgi:hypothetical protein